jgi:hypothetical protein
MSPAVRARANPSYPRRTPDASIERLRRKLAADDFLREGLGIWDEDEAGWDIVTSDQWAATKRPPRSLRRKSETPSLAIASTPDLAWSALAAAVVRDGKTWARIIAYGPGVSWLPKVVREQQVKLGGSPVVVDSKGPCSSLLDDLEDAGVDLEGIGLAYLCDAAAAWHTAVTETDSVRTMSDPELDEQMRLAQWRDIGDRRAFGRRKAGNICALEAASLAAAHAVANDYDVLDSIG